MKNYSRRIWLNPEGHSSSGSVVVFDGDTAWEGHDGTAVPSSFVEIADCHGKVRIHRANLDSKEEFAAKVELLRDTLDEFARHLRA